MSEPRGKVYLVGAGPGDPKLITVRGLEAIRKADVIVYDRLSSPRLLKEAKAGAELIYVGKRPQRHTMRQENINQLLVDLALAGKTVARLKGGDPTLFGRVGEEAELLVDNGITYDIIPGVTSALSAPAYAGIPVTHRDYSSSLAIVTGHENPDKLEMNVQWDMITPSTDTIIFLMGVTKITYIRDQLIRYGKPADTPVALVRWGTRINQKTIVGTLADIAEKVQEQNFKPPAVIIVGEVVKLREKLNWYEKKPLFGRRVLVTRARDQASELSERIDELGGEAYEFPTITLHQPSSEEALLALDKALGKLPIYDWVIFTSVNGVAFFFKRLSELQMDIRQMAKARIAAVGPSTAEALLERGLIAETVPSSFYQAEGLLEALEKDLIAGQHVLLPRGDLSRDYLVVELEKRGLHVTDVHVYENKITADDAEELLQLLSKKEVHIVTFTSSSTVNHLCELLERTSGRLAADLLSGVTVACIGPKTAETAQSKGLVVHKLAAEATIPSLIEAILE
jgi:uroporphyrinogen III methyltransferase/synthase